MALLVFLALSVLAWLTLREARRLTRRRPRQDRRMSERLTDPREAAAILLVQQASYAGPLTVAQKQTILALMRGAFGVDAGEAEGLYSFGVAAIGQTGDAANSLRRLVVPIRDACTLEEMKDLAAMMEQVGAADGPMNEHQRRLLDELRRALSLPDPVQAPRP